MGNINFESNLNTEYGNGTLYEYAQYVLYLWLFLKEKEKQYF